MTLLVCACVRLFIEKGLRVLLMYTNVMSHPNLARSLHPCISTKCSRGLQKTSIVRASPYGSIIGKSGGKKTSIRATFPVIRITQQCKRNSN